MFIRQAFAANLAMSYVRHARCLSPAYLKHLGGQMPRRCLPKSGDGLEMGMSASR